MLRGQCGIVEPQGPHVRRRGVAKHHISTPYQPLHDVPTSRRLVINSDTDLVAIEGQKDGAVTPLTRFQLACPVTRDGLNLDHLRPQVTQEQRAKRARESLRKVQYSHVMERYGHGSWSMAVLVYGGRVQAWQYVSCCLSWSRP